MQTHTHTRIYKSCMSHSLANNVACLKLHTQSAHAYTLRSTTIPLPSPPLTENNPHRLMGVPHLFSPEVTAHLKTYVFPTLSPTHWVVPPPTSTVRRDAGTFFRAAVRAEGCTKFGFTNNNLSTVCQPLPCKMVASGEPLSIYCI